MPDKFDNPPEKPTIISPGWTSASASGPKKIKKKGRRKILPSLP